MRTKKIMKPTRGHGILEEMLSRVRARMADGLIPESARKGRILDIGCGQFPYFLTKTRFAEKFGIDRTVSRANFSDYEVRFFEFDFEQNPRTPFEDGYFDVVTALAVVEHIESRKVPEFLSEIYRILKLGGCYILTTPAAWTAPFLRLMAGLGLISKEEIDEHKTMLTHKKIKHLIKETGFRNAEIRTGYFELGMNLWTLMVKR